MWPRVLGFVVAGSKPCEFAELRFGVSRLRVKAWLSPCHDCEQIQWTSPCGGSSSNIGDFRIRGNESEFGDSIFRSNYSRVLDKYNFSITIWGDFRRMLFTNYSGWSQHV